MSSNKSRAGQWRFLFILWDITGWLLFPVLILYSFWRKKNGKEIPGRLKERFGLLSLHQRDFLARTPQKRLWIHAASVGETLSAFPLIDALLELDKSLVILLTTTTVTGYQIARTHPVYDTRLIHTFLPYDIPLARALFLRHWKPVGSVFIESEIWPGIVRECSRNNIPFMLVNARLSERSAQNWSYCKTIFQAILAPASWINPRGFHDQKHFQKLGIITLPPVGELKEDAPPLRADPATLNALRQKIGSRPVFIAVSTHEGEEEIIITGLKQAQLKSPSLLGIIIPRHPERGKQLAARYNAPRRSLGELPASSDLLWIIDTLGEVGLFLNLSQSAFIGKSLCPPGGGHNPFEPLKAGCRTACGPYMSNWTGACKRLQSHLSILKNENEIAHWIIEEKNHSSLNNLFEKKNVSSSLGRQILTTILL